MVGLQVDVGSKFKPKKQQWRNALDVTWGNERKLLYFCPCSILLHLDILLMAYQQHENKFKLCVYEYHTCV